MSVGTSKWSRRSGPSEPVRITLSLARLAQQCAAVALLESDAATLAKERIAVGVIEARHGDETGRGKGRNRYP